MQTPSPPPPRSRLVRWLLDTALVVSSLLICVVLVELGLRVAGYSARNYTEATDESLFWRYDSLLGWAMQANVQGLFTRPEFSIPVATNALGLRDDEIPLQKRQREFRILLLGDSVTAGFEVARAQTFEALLEARLNALRDGWQYQVINAGFRGYGTDQEYLFLQSRGLALAPDVVVLAFVPANDPDNNVTIHTAGRLYAKPYFEYAADSTLTRRGVPVPAYPREQQLYSHVIPAPANNAEPKISAWLIKVKTILRTRLRMYAFVAERAKKADPGLTAVLQKIGALQQTTPAAFLDFYRSPLPEDWRRRWRVTFDLFVQIKKICDAQGIPLVVWMFPLKEQVYERDQRLLLDGYGLQRAEYSFEQPEHMLRAFCRAHDILFLSPLPRFRAVAKQQRLHYLSDNHFNAAGHAALADTLFDFLRQLSVNAQAKSGNPAKAGYSKSQP